MAAIGGVAVSDDEVEIRGWFRHMRVPRNSISRILVADYRGQVSGRLDTAEGQQVLRGMSMPHRHNLAAHSCSECTDVLRTLRRISSRLHLPLVDLNGLPLPA